MSPTPAQWAALLARVEALEAAQQQSEPIDEKENARRFRACMAAIDAATPEQIRAATPETSPPTTASLRGGFHPAPSAAPAPDGGLVERVIDVLNEQTIYDSIEHTASAAILAVAEWLQEGAGKHGRWLTPANDLRDEVRRG